MKKVKVMFQIIGLLAICALYVVLEITHSAYENPKPGSGSFVEQQTETTPVQDSAISGNKKQNTFSYLNNK